MSKTKMVYVASVLRADTDRQIRINMEAAKSYVDALKVLKIRPVAPHALLPEMLDEYDPKQRALGLEFGIKLLEMCDAIVVFTIKGVISEGMAAEIEKAKELCLPVVYVPVEDMGTQVWDSTWLPSIKNALWGIKEAC